MSRLYEKYLKLKENNKDKLYLFKTGNFYIFLGEDCDVVNNYIVLKKTKFSNESEKCGFPINSIDQYMRVMKNHGLDIEIIEDFSDKEDCNNHAKDIINIIKKIDINFLTPLDAFQIVVLLKEKVK